MINPHLLNHSQLSLDLIQRWRMMVLLNIFHFLCTSLRTLEKLVHLHKMYSFGNCMICLTQMNVKVCLQGISSNSNILQLYFTIFNTLPYTSVWSKSLQQTLFEFCRDNNCLSQIQHLKYDYYYHEVEFDYVESNSWYTNESSRSPMTSQPQIRCLIQISKVFNQFLMSLMSKFLIKISNKIHQRVFFITIMLEECMCWFYALTAHSTSLLKSICSYM